MASKALRNLFESSRKPFREASVDSEGLLVQLEVVDLEAPVLNAETTTTAGR